METGMNLSDLDEALTCPICLHRLSQPVSFGPCNHNYCMPCLISWADARLAHDMEDADDELAGFYADMPLHCPLCRQSGLPASSLASELQTNKALEAACAMVGHSEHSEQEEQHSCSAHRRRLEFYCVDCNQPVCGHCGLIGSHRDHSFREIGLPLLSYLDKEIALARAQLVASRRRQMVSAQTVSHDESSPDSSGSPMRHGRVLKCIEQVSDELGRMAESRQLTSTEVRHVQSRLREVQSRLRGFCVRSEHTEDEARGDAGSSKGD